MRKETALSVALLLLAGSGCATGSGERAGVGGISAPAEVEGFMVITMMRFPDRGRGVSILYTPPDSPQPSGTLEVYPFPSEAVGPDGPNLEWAMESVLRNWANSAFTRDGPATITGPDPVQIVGSDGVAHRGLRARVRIPDTGVDVRYYLFEWGDMLTQMVVRDDGLSPGISDRRALELVADVVGGLEVESQP